MFNEWTWICEYFGTVCTQNHAEWFNVQTVHQYLLTPWCIVLLEKLTGLQLVKKFPAFHGTRGFITALTSFHHLSLSWASPSQSHLLEIHPNIIHPSTPRSPHWSLSLRFPHQDPINPVSSPIRATCPAHLILLDFIIRTILGEEYKPFSSSLCNLLHSPVTSSLIGPNILLNTMFSNTLSFLSSRNVSDQVSHPYTNIDHNSPHVSSIYIIQHMHITHST